MRAFLFPGQGSQAVGMGATLAEASRAARDVFEQVDEALGQNLFRLMREGPDEDLRLTENAQPAIMAHSMAVFAALTKEGGVELAKAASFVAGHSLGEYSALAAAGSFDLPTTAKLLKLRGQAMQQAVPVGQGAMAALLGADLALARRIAEVAAQGEVAAVANDNDPSQVVLSGHKGAIDRVIEIAKEMGAKRAVSLPVSAPFHSPLMQPAVQPIIDELATLEFRAPAFPIAENVSGTLVADATELRSLLERHVVSPVRWYDDAQALAAAGATTFLECGPGDVLTKMAKRVVPGSRALAVGSPEAAVTAVSSAP